MINHTADIQWVLEQLQSQLANKVEEAKNTQVATLQHEKSHGETLGLVTAIGYLNGMLKGWEIQQQVSERFEQEVSA